METLARMCYCTFSQEYSLTVYAISPIAITDDSVLHDINRGPVNKNKHDTIIFKNNQWDIIIKTYNDYKIMHVDLIVDPDGMAS